MIYIYLSYSESEPTGEGSLIRSIADDLESPCSDGKQHAKIINYPGGQSSKKNSIKDLSGNKNQTGQVVLFLCNDRTASGIKINNISKDDAIAKKMNYNFVVCPLPGSINHTVPDWLSDIDKDAKYKELRDLKREIELYDAKKYKVFKDNSGNPVLEPDRAAMPHQPDLDPIVFEQYKLYKQEVEQKENARRVASDAFMTVNSAFLALMGVMLDKENLTSWQNMVFLLIAGILGLLFCRGWNSVLNYYTQITTAKQRIINHLEKYLLPLLLNSTEYYDVMHSIFNKRYKKFDEAQELLKKFQLVWNFCIGASGLLTLIGLILLLFYTSDIPDIIVKII